MIDNHCHVSSGKLEDIKEEIILNLSSNNIEYIIDTGSSLETSIKAYDFSKANELVYSAIGVHPDAANTLNLDILEKFTSMFKDNSKVLAIGEIGLDYYYDTNPEKSIQIDTMMKQLELANSLNCPVVFHIRDGYGDFMKIFKENKKYFQNGFLMHCFSGSIEIANELLKLGAYFSFGGVITFKNAEERRKVFKSIPINNILPETDAPYMSPEPFRGQLNKPTNVKLVIEKMAQLKEMDIGKLDSILTNNSKNLFGRVKK